MSRGAHIFLLVLFFLSGACTLVYQVIWVRMLVLVFGTGAFAVSTVLTAFMAGLALGSFYFGRLADKSENNLRLYALLELGIAAFALAFPLILSGLDEIHTWLYQQLEATPYVFALMRFPLCFLVLLIPTTLMGGTLPILIRFATRHMSQVGWSVGTLYAANTFGAACGVGTAAYLTIEYLGISGTTTVAVVGNVLIAVFSLTWSRRLSDSAEPYRVSLGQRNNAQQKNPPALPNWLVQLTLLVFCASGFTALGYEVLWTRVLTMILGLSTAQSLSIILIAFLLGLALGGAIASRFVGRWPDLLIAFGAVEILLGLFGHISIGAFGASTHFIPYLSALTSWTGYLFATATLIFWITLIPTCLLGVLLPLVGQLNVTHLKTLGTKIGKVYAVNSLGSIGGAFGTGFLLIPLLGTERAVQVLAWTNIALGAVLLLVHPNASSRFKLQAIGLPVGAVLLLTWAMPSNLFIALFTNTEKDSELVYYREGTAGTVTVHQMDHGNRILKVNGMGEVPTDHASIKIFRLLGNLPMILHSDPRQVLVIAFGGGVTLSSVLLHQPERVDCVEVVPGVVEAADFFARYNNYVFNRVGTGRLRLIHGDGRNHVMRTPERYDIIIADATHPGTADSWVLYTEEFYQLCRQRLKTAGLIAQWIPLHGLAVADYEMILRTFRAVFPHATLWLTDKYSIVLGANQPQHIDFELLAQRLSAAALQESLQEVDLADPVSFAGTLALDERAFSDYAGHGPLNTDDRPYISFTDRRRRDTGAGLPALSSLLPHLVVEADESLFAMDEEEKQNIERRLRSRKYSIEGAVSLLNDKTGDAMWHYRQARKTDPDERTALRALRRIEGAGQRPKK